MSASGAAAVDRSSGPGLRALTRRQVLVGVAGGLVVTALVPLVLRSFTLDFFQHELLRRFSELRLFALWFVVFGAALAVILMLSEWNPLVAGVPALLLGIGYATPLDFPLIRTGTWLPWAVREPIFISMGSAAHLSVGMLAAAAVWGAWRLLKAERSGAASGAPGGALARRRGLLAGAVGGVAVAVVLPFLLPTTAVLDWRRSDPSEVARLRGVVLWLILIGVLVAAVVFLSKASPLVAAVPAVLLALAYAAAGPLQLIGPEGWIPSALRHEIAATVGPGPYVIIGVFAGAAAWNTWTRPRSRRQP